MEAKGALFRAWLGDSALSGNGLLAVPRGNLVPRVNSQNAKEGVAYMGAAVLTRKCCPELNQADFSWKN